MTIAVLETSREKRLQFKMNGCIFQKIIMFVSYDKEDQKKISSGTVIRRNRI